MTTLSCASPVQQRGQALVLGLLMAAAGGISLVVLYNLGQTVGARQRLTHAADAAAYSGALEQARALNALAYINRTQIAHQVAMAHLVTLAASAQYARTMQAQRSRGNPPAGLIAMLFGPDVGAAYQTARAVPDAEQRLASAFGEHDRVVHQVLEASAASAVAGLAASRERIMNKVLSANLSDDAPASGAGAATGRGASLRLLTDGWPGYVARRLATRAAGLRPAVEQAVQRHGFLNSRNATRRNPWMVRPLCPLHRHELRRRGYTWLGPDGRWGALDTQSYHALRFNRWRGCYFREYAMGWGTAQGQKIKAPEGLEYVDEPPLDFSDQDFWRWVELSTNWDLLKDISNPMANSYAMAAAQRWPGRGLPAYRDIALPRSGEPLRFAVAVRLVGSSLKTTDADSAVRAPLGRFRYAALGPEDAVTVTSAAETYFARPERRADGRDELATLFRPYWQARLSATTAGEAAQARRAP
ncbi:pilus assembly protein TadG-related protein [Achromobacter xylosoxidans]|uniref:pilus assembly protein TadG-related protein n=2 Tax=Alcaligenes xylosoxydans xylosoxydans TaxID=85698 RepID=UPI000B48BC31|nr:pilus assembly protein TadG-related protein [Achromobacter xylosoxidans]